MFNFYDYLDLAISFVAALAIIVPVLLSVAYFTLVERKILGAIQRRRGPNVIGLYGLLQPLSDGLKLLVKERISPTVSKGVMFIIAPFVTFFLSISAWTGIAFGDSSFADLNITFIYLFSISSFGIYGIILSGWSSNSQYSFLGALRSTAQMISYEVSLGFIMLIISMNSGTFNVTGIIASQIDCWNVIPFFPLWLVFFISGLAETNRHPFDLPEAEAELVSGYNVEYSGMSFAMFSLGEYSNMLIMCSLNVILFFGGDLAPSFFNLDLLVANPDSFVYNIIPNTGWLGWICMSFVEFLILLNDISSFIWFSIKLCFFVILFVWMRAALPRYRYDQLMILGWKIFLPITLFYLVVVALSEVL